MRAAPRPEPCRWPNLPLAQSYGLLGHQSRATRLLRQSVTNHFDGSPRQSSQPSYRRDRGGDQKRTDNQFTLGALDTDAALSSHVQIVG